MSLRRRNSSPPRSPRSPLYISALPSIPETDAASSTPPSSPKARPTLRRSKATHTLIVYVRPVDALVGAAPHMLLVPDARIDADVRNALETAHRASTNTTLGDDNGSRERYRTRAIALCDPHVHIWHGGLARDPRAKAKLPLYPGVLSRYRLLAPESDLAAARISAVYFVYGNLGL